MIMLAMQSISWIAEIMSGAFGAINYAHAWIDAGVKLRLLNGHGDDNLFTLLNSNTSQQVRRV